MGSDQSVDASLDAKTDAGDSGIDPPGELDRTPSQDGVGPDGHDDVGASLSGSARAGRFKTKPDEFTGLWAHCREGDFKLYNEFVKVCVQAETTNIQEVYTGGAIVDAGLVGSTTPDVFNVLKTRIGFNVLFAESVEVVRDGSDGGVAVIRVVGRDEPVAYLVGILGAGLFSSKGYPTTTEYRLHPGAREVEILTWVGNTRDRPRTTIVGDWYAPGDRTFSWRSGIGFGDSNQPFQYLAGRSDHGSVFGWLPEGQTATIDELPFSAKSPWLLLNLGPKEIPPLGESVYRRWVYIGDGRMESVRTPILDRLEAPDANNGTTGGREDMVIRVLDAEGAPVAGRLVTLSSGENYEVADTTDASGELSVSLLPQPWTVQVEGVLGGQITETEVDLSSASSADVTVPSIGSLTVNAASAGAPITALVRIHGAATGEFFVTKGMGSIELAPGTYTLRVSKGMEYSVAERELTVVAGESTTWDTVLNRTVDTLGWIASDFHQHTEPSTDSDVLVFDRILDNVAEGVEFVGFTDHDVVAHFQPYIDEIGMTDEIRTFPGVEISPTSGHINIYPIEPDFNARGNGTITLARIENEEVVVRTIPDIFATARAMANNPLIQINHPRGGTSYFETVSYEPDVDPTTFMHPLWSTDFDSLEIINRVDATCSIFADWSTFHNMGLRRTGLGNSDTHRVLNGDTPGKVRNYLRIAEEPADLDEADVKAAIKDGHVTVGMHAFLDFQDGKYSGQTIAASAGDVSFAIRVQTPEWSQVTKLFVIVNGAIIQTLDRTGTNGNDFDDVILVPITEDSWVTFFAWGPEPSNSDYGNPAISFNNPIFVDIGDDGWAPPGMRTLDLEGLNVNGWCD